MPETFIDLYAKAVFFTSRSAFMTPAEGEALFISAIIPNPFSRIFFFRLNVFLRRALF